MHRKKRLDSVINNLPLVGYLVADLCAKAPHLSREDLAGAGAVALVASSHSYDPELGVPFGAFARRRILGALADNMRASDWATGPAGKRIKTTREFREVLTGDLGRTATVDELAAALGMNRLETNAALADASRSVTPLEKGAAALIAEDLSAEASAPAPDDRMMLGAAVRALPERMRYIVEQIYFEDRCVKSVADELQTTHSAVSQQRAEAMRLLRGGLDSCGSPSARSRAKARSYISAPGLASYLTNVSALTSGGLAVETAPAAASWDEPAV